MTAEKTTPDQLDREWLKAQHIQRRGRAEDAWQRVGLGAGDRVLDLGCGTGMATLELAGLVGPAGEVTAVDRSGMALEFLQSEASRLGLTNIRAIQADLDTWVPVPAQADVVWMRWIAAFLTDPRDFITRTGRALRPGGHVIWHEYGDMTELRAWLAESGLTIVSADTSGELSEIVSRK